MDIVPRKEGSVCGFLKKTFSVWEMIDDRLGPSMRIVRFQNNAGGYVSRCLRQ